MSVKQREPPIRPNHCRLPPDMFSQPGQKSLILSCFLSSLLDSVAPLFKDDDLRSFCRQYFSKIDMDIENVIGV